MLRNFSLAVIHLERNGRTYHICISLAYSKGKIRRIVHTHAILVVIVKLCAIGGKLEEKPQGQIKEFDSDVSVSENPFMCYYVKLCMMLNDCYDSLSVDFEYLPLV